MIGWCNYYWLEDTIIQTLLNNHHAIRLIQPTVLVSGLGIEPQAGGFEQAIHLHQNNWIVVSISDVNRDASMSLTVYTWLFQPTLRLLLIFWNIKIKSTKVQTLGTGMKANAHVQRLIRDHAHGMCREDWKTSLPVCNYECLAEQIVIRLTHQTRPSTTVKLWYISKMKCAV